MKQMCNITMYVLSIVGPVILKLIENRILIAVWTDTLVKHVPIGILIFVAVSLQMRKDNLGAQPRLLVLETGLGDGQLNHFIGP